MTKADLVKRAEEILDIEIHTASNGRLAHYAPETGEWYWITLDDLEYAEDVAREYPDDTYSHWCAGTSARVVRDPQRAGLS